MEEITLLGISMSPWLAIPLLYFVWVTALSLLKIVIFKPLNKLAERTRTEVDNIFLKAIDLPLTLIIFTSGGAFIEQMLPMITDQEITRYFLIIFKATTIIAVVLFVDKFINNLILYYSREVEVLKTSGGIARGVTRAIVIGLGLLILLDSFGVSITPVIASLGIGSLAVALALQPMLENFFSGVQLVIDKPIKVGHFVKLESGEEGYVHKIGWRSTWVRLLANNMVIVPNKTIVNSKVVNYYYPQQEMSTIVQVGVHYESDLKHVERVTIEVAKEVMGRVDGCVTTFEPFIRYHTFADFSINFSVILRVKEFVNNYLLKHEFVKALHERYAKEGINIPYPIRAINYDQEKAFAEADQK